ncbi:uncharacterized protein PAC_02502 [Phialocephala subalpina]|uniref:C2H2-type domain-containing protein n=1 Tax=Phialocephala subalpina TaxID=576137 RepID=A0A1L7WIN1_9HELO|nr:uncharacterized protein PAC_02502 [Phialocephala subalpina]
MEESVEDASRSVSTSMEESSSLSPSESAGENVQDGLQATHASRSRSPAQTSPSADEWLCRHPNCGRSFTHRHKLNRHQKYHSKLHRCLHPSCFPQGVAFSLRKDLDRHQSQHDGRRFYCPHVGCLHAINGAEGGFTRRDNLQRHLTNQHRRSQQ